MASLVLMRRVLSTLATRHHPLLKSLVRQKHPGFTPLSDRCYPVTQAVHCLCTKAGIDNTVPSTHMDHTLLHSKILNDISGLGSLQDVFGFLEDDAAMERLQPVHFSPLIVKLEECTFKRSEEVPWMQNFVSVAFIQLVINDKLEEFMQPVTTNPGFKKLTEKIYGNIQHFSGEDLSRTMLALLRLGVPPEDHNMHKMLYRCHDICEEASLPTLVNLVEIIRSSNKTDPVLTYKVSNRLDQLISEVEPSPDSAFLVTKAVLPLMKIFSNRLVFKASWKVLELLDNPQALEQPEHLGSYLWFSQKIYYNLDCRENQLHLRLLERSTKAIKTMVDTLQPQNIAEICNHLRICQYYDKEIEKQMQERSLELIRRTSKISDMSNLLYAFTRDTPLEMRREIEHIIFKELHNADVLLISNIAASLSHMQCRNRDLLSHFQDMVIRNTDRIVNHFTRFQKVVMHLQNIRFLDRANEMRFTEAVLGQLDLQYGLSTWNVSTIAGYLLPRTKYVISDKLYKKLLTVLPQCTIQRMWPIIAGINKMRAPATPQLRTQVLNLQSAIQSNISNRLHEIDSLESLHNLITLVTFRQRNRDPTLVENLMEMFPKFTKNLSELRVTRLTRLFSNLSYLQPEVIDDLVAYVIANRDTVSLQTVQDILHTCFRVYCIPKRHDEFCRSCKEVYKRHAKTLGIEGHLKFAHAMAKLQCFPEDILANIFSLDFIQEIDRYLEEEPFKRREIETQFMDLNRMVVLECPEMDVPWFHEDYCQEMIRRWTKKPESRSPKGVLMQEVHDAMVEVMGGDKFFTRDAITPYYYSVSFEAVLGDGSKPVAMEMVDRNNVPLDFSRLCVRVFHDSAYCYSSSHLQGSEQVRNRHLEILGYQLVQIPHFEWNSMALTDWQSKVDYLKSKIFN